MKKLNKKLSVKSWLSNIILESEDTGNEIPKFSPDNISSVSNVQIKPEKGVIIIDFTTKDNRNAQFKTKSINFFKWLRTSQEDDENPTYGFVVWFLKHHQQSVNKVMSELVDEYNGLIGDEDMPKNSDRMIGLSTKDSTSDYQSRTKGWDNFNTGAISGFVSW